MCDQTELSELANSLIDDYIGVETQFCLYIKLTKTEYFFIFYPVQGGGTLNIRTTSIGCGEDEGQWL